MRNFIFITLIFNLLGCVSKKAHLDTNFSSNTCIKPLTGYIYTICNDINFSVNDRLFTIPKNFKTDLANIPKVVRPIVALANSSLIKPAIVHDWFYRKTCDFSRLQTDLIFYHMLINNGVSHIHASIMYWAVRLFGWKYYNEDYCDDELKGMDQDPRELQLEALYGYSR